MNLPAWLEQTLQDSLYAVRILRKSAGTTAIMIVTLALGIGATTAIFSVVEAVMLRQLPYRDPERLTVVWDSPVHDKGIKIFAPYRHFQLWRDKNTSFAKLAGETWAIGPRFLMGHGAPQSVLAIPSTVELFDVLGVAPELGRTFVRDDLQQACTVVLAHKFWQTRLGGKADIVGQRLTLDDASCTVVGVMPANFVFYPLPTELWTLITPNSMQERNPDKAGIAVFGRLKPGVARSAAQAELKLLAIEIDHGHGFGADIEPVAFNLQDEFVFLAGRNLRLSLMLLAAAVGFVLLIACVNVANLLLGRSLARQRELAVRAALGSSRARLIRQLLTESLLLSIAAGVVGVALAETAVYYFKTVNPVELTPGAVLNVNTTVLAFAGMMALLTTVISGLAPAWRASNGGIRVALQSGGRSSAGRSRQRLARVLVVAEVALSLVLLAGAGLMIESTINFASADLGFRPDRLLLLTVTLPAQAYAKPDERVHYYDLLRSRIGTEPGIEGIGWSTRVAMRGSMGQSVLNVEGRPPADPKTAIFDTQQQAISDGYLRFMGIPLRRGREFAWADRGEKAPVAVVNEALVREYFPNQDPLGRRVQVGAAENPWVTIVGVVADEKQSSPFQEMGWASPPIVYRPLAQQTNATFDLVVRSGLPTAGIQHAIERLDPEVRIGNVETMQHAIARHLSYPRLRAVLMGAFAGLGLLLAVVGLYGVLAQLVGQRTQEIGIRMALGAQRRHVLGAVVKEGMLLVIVGGAVGFAASAWLGRFVESLLYGVKAEDPATVSAVAVVLIAAGLLATYLPARRAAGVDPAVSLRCE